GHPADDVARRHDARHHQARSPQALPPLERASRSPQARGSTSPRSARLAARKLLFAVAVSGRMKILFLMLFSSAALADESCFLSGGKAEGTLCKERLPPCSSFKLPLAVMAIDSGILDEKTILKWDKTPQRIKSWEQDADAKIWLKESIVWFSQRLTPQLGLPKIQKYLKDFEYGNQDFSGGITTAWLESSLQISPEGQVKFLEKLPNSAAGKRAIALLPVDGDVRGKTGSCMTPHIGWFVGYHKDKPFVFVSDRPTESYAGLEAKKTVLSRFRAK